MCFDPDKDAVRDLIGQYDDEASAYLDHWAPVIHPIACAIVDKLPRDGVRRVMDVGAGVGLLLPVLQEKFPDAHVMGIDRSDGMLSLCRPGDSVAVMDAAGLGVQSASLDLIVMVFMLFHLPDPVAGLSEARRSLRPGGALCLTTWAGDLDSPLVDIWNEAMDEHGAVTAESIARLARHDLMDSPAKVEGLLVTAGFDRVRSDVQEFSHTIEAEEFIRLRMRIGSNRRRFDSLRADAREKCIAHMRERLHKLPDEDFIMRMNIICTTAKAPA